MFDIRLDAAQQAQYDAIINNPANGGVNRQHYEGLSASFGCVVVAPGCGPSSDGADSFLAFSGARSDRRRRHSWPARCTSVCLASTSGGDAVTGPSNSLV